MVGYLSTDFGEHPTSHLMRSVWRLQRERRTVRAVCFARSDDRSEQRAHIAATCEEFVELTGLSWRDAAERIRQRRVMILVDLNGHCGRPQFELLSLRPAPLQLTYMGHPGTSGAPFVQYVAVDAVVAPPRLAPHFSERLLSLPHWHVTDYRDAHAFAALGAPPAGAPSAGAGLPWPAGATRPAVLLEAAVLPLVVARLQTAVLLLVVAQLPVAVLLPAAELLQVHPLLATPKNDFLTW